MLLVPGISAQAEDGEVLQLRSGIEVPLTEDELWKSGEVYFAGVRAPLGAFVLAKRGQDRCAIVIDKIWEEGEDLPPSTWSGGGRKQFASYTAYYRQDGADKLVASNYRSVSGILSRLSPMGPGRLALAKGSPAWLRRAETALELPQLG
ncbi:MAG: hypothetical protein LC114_26780 [Bryobacterales bacterium]|nr:hypothetical protein [Bryobacterales bacterium]